MRHRLGVAALLSFLILPVTTFGRVISYSPYTDRVAFPAHQHRMNRHFALIEYSASTASPFASAAQLVLYDFRGEKEPAVVFPQTGTASIFGAAVRENSAQRVSLLVLASTPGESAPAYHLSTDGGATWRRLSIPGTFNVPMPPYGNDIGGPFAAARGSQIRIGTDDWPFVVSNRTAVYAVSKTGTVRSFTDFPTAGSPVSLVGTDAAGRRTLVTSGGTIHAIDVQSGLMTQVAPINALGIMDGWISPSGEVYLEERTNATTRIVMVRDGVRTVLRETPNTGLNLFAVPTFDYSGAWIIERGPGKPTSLYRHDPSSGLQKQWEDITAPQVEALHAGSSGTKLLVQVHRPRPQADQRIFQDPALAVWRVGQPAPREYDELYLDEQFNKGFVHLDVETLEDGEPFVFDSGVRMTGGGGGVSAGGGGGDVVQEWGVVRGSLKQRLVLPAVGRTAGGHGSFWVTDVTLQNPYDTPQRVDIRFVPSGADTVVSGSVRSVTLAANGIRLIEDVLHSTFGLESGLGAFVIEPAKSITMTSRTYTRSAAGTYGFGMPAIDLHASAASSRFPLTFSGAFLGQNYRTNIVIVDAGESGVRADVRAAGPSGLIGLANVGFEVAPRGQQQLNSIETALALYPHETGALLFRPTRGTATAAVFATDNRTNDSTYFPPDLPAPLGRTIPAIGHVDGANNSRFRSDLYLYNPSSTINTVILQLKMWDSPQQTTVNLTMLPNEARVITDVVQTLFGRTGIARLRYQSFGTTAAVRVTSRTYSVDEDGGTYGFLVPPLNNFQIGGLGDSLEILGAHAAAHYRTNIGLVDVAPFPGPNAVNVRIDIINAAGATIDSFNVSVPSAGGMQINDVFGSRGIVATGPILIRATPLNGVAGAYATFIDNRTNDAVYLSSNLAAKD